MKLRRGFFLALILIASSAAHGGTIRGTARNLDGSAISDLTDFAVVALVGGVEVATGVTTPGSPTYEITIDPSKLSRDDVRVTLVFSAAGRDTAVYAAIAGETISPVSAQTIDPVMPRANPPFYYYYYPTVQHQCQLHAHKRLHFFGGRR